MSNEIKLNLNRKGSITLINNDHSFCSIPSAWPQEPIIICKFLGIIICIGVYEAFPHMLGYDDVSLHFYQF